MKTNNINERCTVKGSGKPIILVHGMGGPQVLKPVSDLLSKEFKVIIPTLPGFLKKDGKIDYSDELYIDFLEKVREYFKLDQFKLAGFSMGGRTVINYTLQYKNKVSKLIIIDSVGIGNMSIAFKMPIISHICPCLIRIVLSKPKNIEGLVRNDYVNHDGESSHYAIKWFSQMIDPKDVLYNWSKTLVNVGVEKKTWSTQLQQLKTKTLILWGSDDTTAPLKWGYKLNSLIKNSSISILEGYKHAAIAEKPEFFSDKIIKFLKKKKHEDDFFVS